MSTTLQISVETVHLIEETLLGCEKCSPQAAIAFESVLDRLTHRNGEAPGCVLLGPAKCPACLAPVGLKTRVQWTAWDAAGRDAVS